MLLQRIGNVHSQFVIIQDLLLFIVCRTMDFIPFQKLLIVSFSNVEDTEAKEIELYYTYLTSPAILTLKR